MIGENRYLGQQGTAPPSEAAMLKLVLEQLAFGILVIDARCAIHYANSFAKTLLERIFPGATREDQLFKRKSFPRRRLEGFVAQGGGALTISRGMAHPPLELLVTPLADLAPNRARPAAAGLALVCVLDPDSVPTSFGERLQQLYGVTPAEARVAGALSRGARLVDGAHALGVKQETVRSHVKRLCQKLGTKRKAELLWRLNVCAATLIVARDWLESLNRIL